MGCINSCHKKQKIADPITEIIKPVIREVITVDRLDNQLIANFMSQVRPLDLIVFRGRDTVSKIIRDLEIETTGNGEVSHVEVAITCEWCSKIVPQPEFNIKPDTMLSWTSTMSGNLNDGAVNVETGGASFGTQFRILENLVRRYLTKAETNVGLCRLIDNPTCMRAGETHDAYIIRANKLKEDLNRAYDKFSEKQYDINPLSLLGAMFPVVRPFRDAGNEIIQKYVDVNSWLFCSELVAAVYIEVGVINDETDGVKDGRILDAANVLPVDFLGVDADKYGIKNAICETKPIWIKERKEVYSV